MKIELTPDEGPVLIEWDLGTSFVTVRGPGANVSFDPDATEFELGCVRLAVSRTQASLFVHGQLHTHVKL